MVPQVRRGWGGVCGGPQKPTERLAGRCGRCVRHKINLTLGDADFQSFEPCSWHTPFAKRMRMGGRIHKNPGALEDQFPEMRCRGMSGESGIFSEFPGIPGFHQHLHLRNARSRRGVGRPNGARSARWIRRTQVFAPAHPDGARPKMSVFGVVIRMGRRSHPPPPAPTRPTGSVGGPVGPVRGTQAVVGRCAREKT